MRRTLFTGSDKVRGFRDSVFSEFTGLCIQHKAVNLGQGFPDWEAPDFVKQAAVDAVTGGHNQYNRSMGHPLLVNTLEHVYKPRISPKLNGMANIVVTAGATEAMFAALLAIVSDGDEVLIVQPHYDAYPAQVQMARGIPKFISMKPDPNSTSSSGWRIDMHELKTAITPRTRALIINTPHNPLGKVLSLEELESIAEIVLSHENLFVISDEVYEWIVFDDAKHVSIASLDGMWDRTITISSAGKTFSCTGWKIGWTVANDSVSRAIAMAHQWIPFCTTTPLQVATAHCFQHAMSSSYMQDLKNLMASNMSTLLSGLKPHFECCEPEGGYFIMSTPKKELKTKLQITETSNDFDVARNLIKKNLIGSIPLSAFYSFNPPIDIWLRWAYCKRPELIQQGLEKLHQL